MFSLKPLPYAPEALEPVISARTLEFHHGKHLATYVKNLNAAIEGTPLAELPLEDIIVKAVSEGLTPVFNNAGQVLNHEMYFEQFAPAGTGCAEPRGALKSALEAAFGTVDAFRSQFAAAGAGVFGSGWVWLQADSTGALSIGKYTGADNPVAHGLKPLLTFDVWEHAYYLDYQNRRPDYLAALWQILDWKVVASRL
jgi:Fe-Mn family superoxide dismutase